jgi:hypothetical protein
MIVYVFYADIISIYLIVSFDIYFGDVYREHLCDSHSFNVMFCYFFGGSRGPAKSRRHIEVNELVAAETITDARTLRPDPLVTTPVPAPTMHDVATMR